MAYAFPGPQGISEISEQLELDLTPEEVGEYHAYLSALTPAFRLIEQLPDELPAVKYPRTPGYRPEGAENPHNGWVVKSNIKGAPQGKLKGKTLAIKDSVMVAGVPMSNGASILDGYVPDIDATIVTRILDAGGEILGKASCEYLCIAGNSVTGVNGPVQNPRVPGRSTGGSSTGSAALVAAGDVDMAIGADQAGSIRMPASFCGIVGLKPTYGLVPYTGAASIEYTFDHVGPMTRTVADCALLLEVIAGEDGIDGRQRNVQVQPYTEALGQGVKGLKIGVVQEGFARAETEAGVDDAVRAELKRLASMGAIVEEVSIPWHNIGSALWLPIGIEGSYHNIVRGHGVGYGGIGAYSLGFMKAYESWPAHASELAAPIKAVLLSGRVLERHGGRLYAKAQNLRRRLRAEYDAQLAKYDVLVMPTTPMTATPMPGPDAGPQEVVNRSWEMLLNTSPFDLTGHPAISVCCGEVEDRPVGFMVVGRHFDEQTVFRVAEVVHRG
ncbi:amidase [Pusillimonas minor]|uniref:Amidase n=1 Tax=Pusillimonas minor TaxID=2697024 RepID=A0A842HRN9_9BURK|nr:amidase [Pusillimonas minor]MBC2769515.1 amidase [Pusillimonas minor]